MDLWECMLNMLPLSVASDNLPGLCYGACTYIRRQGVILTGRWHPNYMVRGSFLLITAYSQPWPVCDLRTVATTHNYTKYVPR